MLFLAAWVSWGGFQNIGCLAVLALSLCARRKEDLALHSVPPPGPDRGQAAHGAKGSFLPLPEELPTQPLPASLVPRGPSCAFQSLDQSSVESAPAQAPRIGSSPPRTPPGPPSSQGLGWRGPLHGQWVPWHLPPWGERVLQACFPQAGPKRSHVGLAEGVWREFLDLHAGLEDTPAPLAYSLKDWPPGDLSRRWPSHALKPRSQGHLEDSLWSHVPGLPVRAAGRALAPLGADDVDMQPVEGDGPGVMEGAWGPLLPAGESLEPGRRVQGGARVSQQPPRLGSERDKGHRLPLSKRKLELLLSEPEKRKRKRQP